MSVDSALVNLLIDGVQYPPAPAVLKSQADATKAAIADFLALGISAPSGSALLPVDPGPNATKSYVLLHQVALLVNGFKMTVAEVAYLTAHGSDFAKFDLNALPLDRFNPEQTDQHSIDLFSQWQRLNDLFTVRSSLPQGEVGLLDVFRASSLDEAKRNLATATGWDAGELDILTGSSIDPLTNVPLGFSLALGDFKNEIKLVSLQACWVLIKRLGVSARQLFNWAGQEPDLTNNLAEDIKNTAKAKYDDDSWLSIAKPYNDVLRESQKAALIAYLLTDPSIKAHGINDSSGLYEHFLIDVDMSACMLTSRIVQANSAIQLFVQRCLMNLESNLDPNGKELGVSPAAIDADQWHNWRKRYRFWEANRKVLLYPENWIEPELRDDKTPFFRELESELLQNDVTKDTVEQAFLNYLEKLDEVARLDIRGMCWQKKEADDKSDILHVFGRSFKSPYIYYYRRLRVATGIWTPWEKVQIDIEGDHLIPVVWNRRLYLFWPMFIEKARQPTEEEKKAGEDPTKYWEIKLAWSEYWQSKWSAKKVSPPFSPSGLANFGKADLSFKGVVDGDLVITCYALTPFPDQWSTPIGSPRFALRITCCLDSIALDETGGGAFWMLLPTGTTIGMMNLVEMTPETSDQLRVIEGQFPVNDARTPAGREVLVR